MSYVFVAGTSQKREDFCQNTSFARVPLEPFHGEAALAKAYPLTRGLLPPKEWGELVGQFFASHPPQTIAVGRAPKGLCEFVRQLNWGEKINIPYLADLLEFEWAEVEVYMMPRIENQPYQTAGDLLQDVLYVNPEHRFHLCAYPIFEKQPLPSTVSKGEYHLFCFRHPKTAQVHFISLSPFHRCVIEQLLSGEHTGKEAAMRAAEKYAVDVTPAFLDSIRQFYQDLFTQEAILGFL